MKFVKFSEKQLLVQTWWMPENSNCERDAIICDGAVRSGKTSCMSVSFITWASFSFNGCNFAICGKTIGSLRRNVITDTIPIMKSIGFEIKENLSRNLITVTYHNHTNTFYLFGGKDESSASLIQGLTLAGVMFDEVALQVRSFVEQAMARCSVEKSKFWFNCNPDSPQHWFYQNWIKKVQ